MLFGDGSSFNRFLDDQKGTNLFIIKKNFEFERERESNIIIPPRGFLDERQLFPFSKRLAVQLKVKSPRAPKKEGTNVQYAIFASLLDKVCNLVCFCLRYKASILTLN